MIQIKNNQKIRLARTGPVGYIDVQNIARISLGGFGDTSSIGVVEIKKALSLSAAHSYGTPKILLHDGTYETFDCSAFDYLVLEVTTADTDENLEVLFSVVPFGSATITL